MRTVELFLPCPMQVNEESFTKFTYREPERVMVNDEGELEFYDTKNCAHIRTTLPYIIKEKKP